MDEERIIMDEETTKRERRKVKCGWYMLGILDHIVFVAAMLVGMWIKTSNIVFLVTGGCGLVSNNSLYHDALLLLGKVQWFGVHTFVGSNQMYLSSLVWLSSRSDILHWHR